MAMSTFSKSAAALPPSVLENPFPISFVFKVKKMDKVDATVTNMTESIKLEFLMDPDNSASGSKYSHHLTALKVI
jgi:hypothetical protein